MLCRVLVHLLVPIHLLLPVVMRQLHLYAAAAVGYVLLLLLQQRHLWTKLPNEKNS